MTEGKIDLPNETTSAESKQLLAERDDLRFDGGGSFAGLVMGSAGDFEEAARPLLLIAAQPLAHGGDGGLKRRAVGLMTRCRADRTKRKR